MGIVFSLFSSNILPRLWTLIFQLPPCVAAMLIIDTLFFTVRILLRTWRTYDSRKWQTLWLHNMCWSWYDMAWTQTLCLLEGYDCASFQDSASLVAQDSFITATKVIIVSSWESTSSIPWDNNHLVAHFTHVLLSALAFVCCSSRSYSSREVIFL